MNDKKVTNFMNDKKVTIMNDRSSKNTHPTSSKSTTQMIY